MTIPTVFSRSGHIAVALVALTTLFLAGCDRPDYESPIVNQDGPVIDIAKLPDIEQTTTEMIDLIERVRLEVVRLVPASEPWEWNREQTGTGCEQNGQKGVRRYLRSLESKHSFDDAEWAIVFPAVKRLAAEAGLTDIAAPQNEPGNHDMRFSSDDGRTLMFGSRVASLITGDIACRAREGEGA
ncbi:hypothetical protein MycrhN_1957 [Mycolicibacterium rhodesiae NBB3]|jgi:hypothetical protein|uniref:Lipoprotein LppV n=1 Tax=Mycolicibacterium rhodesiae (strain NBB3) TaxID=710685 RepID=G8RNN4_MYCRN|nr:LppA family lipoprotein [Mycolicibacterium rhodesiae]AEV72564.1 hypothetical protein MycrhN_1957 [Mycolicibacterium rhodesiae NBB3]